MCVHVRHALYTNTNTHILCVGVGFVLTAGNSHPNPLVSYPQHLLLKVELLEIQETLGHFI